MNDYEKIDRIRNMEISLLSLLTIEMIVVVTGYYAMDTIGIFNNNISDWFFISWIISLSAAPFLAMVTTPLNFALCRVGFRITHLATIVYIFYHTGQMTVSVYVIGLCFLEFVYLVVGISNEKMTYPGKLFTKPLQFRQLAHHSPVIERTRGCDNMNYPIVEVNDSSDDEEEELFDDLCYNYTKNDSTPKIC